MHRRLLDVRHRIYAHSDADSYLVEPYRSRNQATAVTTQPVIVLTRSETELIRRMTEMLRVAFTTRLQEIAGSAAGPDSLPQGSCPA